jgi:hypothetical protein
MYVHHTSPLSGRRSPPALARPPLHPTRQLPRQVLYITKRMRASGACRSFHALRRNLVWEGWKTEGSCLDDGHRSGARESPSPPTPLPRCRGRKGRIRVRGAGTEAGPAHRRRMNSGWENAMSACADGSREVRVRLPATGRGKWIFRSRAGDGVRENAVWRSLEMTVRGVIAGIPRTRSPAQFAGLPAFVAADSSARDQGRPAHHPITPSPHHPITPSPHHPFTRSPVHPFTRSPPRQPPPWPPSLPGGCAAFTMRRARPVLLFASTSACRCSPRSADAT